MTKIFLILISLQFYLTYSQNIPIVITTWNFINSTSKAWEVLQQEKSSALDAIEKGCAVCEQQQCDGTVGYGGSPDENGETTLDALIMDGKSMSIGSVAALRRIKNAIGVARKVMKHTRHTLLVGNLATEFAKQMGFPEESLTTRESKNIWMKWHNKNHCQPNFWKDVRPDPNHGCGPYAPKEVNQSLKYVGPSIDKYNHDTIGMVAIDARGDIAAGTSTNGARHKIPGRVGDSPIPGAGAYADNAVGGAAATGDGDVMMRFLPSFLAVEEMRRGATPAQAAKTAIQRITNHYPDFKGALIALAKDGRYAAACHGLDKFPYVVHDKTSTNFEPKFVKCF